MLPLPELNFRRTPVTLILGAIAVALEVVCQLDGRRRGYYYDDLRLGIWWQIWVGELWRPFTTTILHGGLIHVAFNVYWLAVFGRMLEGVFGSYRFLALVVLLAYVSTMPQYVIADYAQPHGAVGLSGVVYGLFGMLWVGRRWRPEFEAVCNRETGQMFIGWFVFCIVATYAGVMNVANIAHGAGFLFGVLYGLAAFDAARRWRWLAVACAASALVLATLVYCPGHAGYESAQQWRAVSLLFQQLLEQVRHQGGVVAPDKLLDLGVGNLEVL